MRRLLISLCALLAALIVVPPILGSLLGWNDFSAALPGPGRRVELRPGAYVNVVESGEGEPVVLVHGLPGSAYDWKPLPERLEALGCRVIRYDRVGFGHSSRRAAAEPHTLEANARDLLGLLDALGLERVTLVGWSYGGGVSQMAAELAPQRLRALALVGSIGPVFRPTAPGLFQRILFSKPVAWWGFRVGATARANTAWISARAFSPDEVTPWWVDQTLALIALPGAFDSMRAENERMDGGLIHPERIRTRTIVFQGAEDKLVPRSVGEDLHERLAQSELLVVPGGSHMLPVTHAQLLGEKVAGLAGCSRRSGVTASPPP